MDYNNIDEDDIENLRLAALMTIKQRANVPINTIGNTSEELRQSQLANCNYFKNSAKNYKGRFLSSNRYFKRIFTNVGLRRPTYANNKLIAIKSTDSESDPQPNDTTSKNLDKNIKSKHMLISDGSKSTDIQNLKSEVPTKCNRLEKELYSEESDDSDAIKLPLQSSLYRRSVSPSSSPRRLSTLRNKNLSLRRYTPPKSQCIYRYPSPRRIPRSSRELSPYRRRLSPFKRWCRSPLKMKSNLRLPKVSTVIRIRSPSPLKEVFRSRYHKSSSTIQSKDDKIMVDNLKEKEEVIFIEKQVKLSSLDSVLEARKRKFESNKPIELTNKRLFLKKTNTVAENIDSQNKNIESVIKSKTVDLTINQKKEDLTLQAPQKRPRITFEHDDTNVQIINDEYKFDQHNYEPFEVPSISKEQSQKIQQMEDDKIESIQHNDTANLRTEIELRLNMMLYVFDDSK